MAKENTNKIFKLPSTRKDLFRGLSILIAVLLIGYGAYGLHGWWSSTHGKKGSIVKQLNKTVTNSTDKPDESKVDPKSNYQVAADMPRQITLPTINSSGFIQRVATDQHNAVAVPTNIHFAGWYTNSSKPGEAGLSVIDGHVGGRYTDAIFKNLTNLKKNDKFSVQYGDNSERSFQVISVKSYPVADAAKQLFQMEPNVYNQLKLITCTGKYDSKSAQFDQRVIVTAKFIPNS